MLQPLWHDNHETARKARARIASIIDFAMAKDWRPEGLNPARWRGNLDKLLGRRPVEAATKHYPALPWEQMPAFMAALRQREAMAARMLELVIYSACRSNEACGALWGEMDLDRGVWTIPAARAKAGAEHRVALSPAAVAMLRGLLPSNDKLGAADPVFPNARGKLHSNMAMAALLDRMQEGTANGKPRWRDADGRAITVHGMRSAFRDWAGETTAHPREVVEGALSHRVGDKTERAYARGDLFTRRARLMADWADYLGKAPAMVVTIERELRRPPKRSRKASQPKPYRRGPGRPVRERGFPHHAVPTDFMRKALRRR
ncbi:tyrosine-type recombinase/integrase [Dankookia sp. P2]|uniref:tyrosine-type recombinase/integrase n=1 Tax=Dankookia sp. P2 TaxID=3423955 RepID=UPI003D664ED1